MHVSKGWTEGHIEKSGRWYVVRFWKDIPGQEKPEHVRERICPVSGPGVLSKADRKVKAKEIIYASGVDSPEYFKGVVHNTTPSEVTFREKSEIWLEWSRTRRRNPISANYAVTIQGALDKWILPVLGDLPLSAVDNLSVVPLVEKMCASGLSARTVNKYVEFVQQTVASLKGPNGEPIHKRVWDAETMDLPIVEYSEQKRPSLKAEPVSKLIQGSSGQEQALYILLAATGMRISEALALETRHFSNDGRTITVEQQVEKNVPRIAPYLKTDAAKREIDLHPQIAEYLQHFATGQTGLLFRTRKRTRYLPNNIEQRWLTPRLEAMHLDEKGMGWHSFRRFRKTWLRSQRCFEDVSNFWMGHKPSTMSELYSHLHEEAQLRLDEAERVGFGFSIVPNVPKLVEENAEAVAA